MTSSDARATLGVASDANWSDVNAAYRQLALRLHPDRHHGDGRLMAELNVAFDLLRNEIGPSAEAPQSSIDVETYDLFENAPAVETPGATRNRGSS